MCVARAPPRLCAGGETLAPKGVEKKKKKKQKSVGGDEVAAATGGDLAGPSATGDAGG